MSDNAAPPPPPPPPPGPGSDGMWTNVAAETPKKPWWKRWWGIALIAFAVLVLIGVIAGGTEDTDGDLAADDADPEETVNEETDPDPEPEPDTDSDTGPEPEPEADPEPEPEPDPEPEPAPEPDTDMTAGQENALRSARDYLNLSGFSRSGLIGQLEFEGYTTEEATFAVDALDVDWRDQAVRSAEDYLNLSGFSRSGLIDQLMFEGYTREEAEYGATEAGL